ncbi:uncharacterized protein JCM6883_005707 [Sporobolomyces salmoneus]|uniref:uncharacterized protein n=1 Tax=Sporobolomyces salmoneus TaxID=183962 RepID=UPI0031732135
MPNERGGMLSNFRRNNANESQSADNSSSSSSYLPDPSALLKDLAPNLLSSSSRILHPANLQAHQQSLISHSSSANDPSTIESLRRKLSFLKTGLSIEKTTGGWGQLSSEIYIRDRVEELLKLPIPPSPFQFTSSSLPSTSSSSSTLAIEPPQPPPRSDETVPLIQGFQATIPTSNQARFERRKRRALESEQRLGLKSGSRLGLKERGDRARGLLGNVQEEEEEELKIGRSSPSATTTTTTKGRIEGGKSTTAAAPPVPSRNDLEGDLKAIGKDMNNVAVRRALLNGQIRDVEMKIKELEVVRDGFRKNLLGLREEELELEDEMEGIQATLARLPLVSTDSNGSTSSTSTVPASATRTSSLGAASSRRRKGPAFLPSEHDDLPTSVAFMTLHGHLSPITSLDFSAPYQTLVTSSLDSSVRLWDLTTGEPTGYLKGHDGIVKVLQVEGNFTITGGKDGKLKVWDLEKAQEEFVNGPSMSLGKMMGEENEEDIFGGGRSNGKPSSMMMMEEDNGLLREEGGGSIRSSEPVAEKEPEKGSCLRTMEGHTKAVTSLYFDGPTLLTGSSDSTLRQWDLNTGQCVLTMDILWALSNPLPSSSTHYPASSYSASTIDPFEQSFSSNSSSPPTTPRKNFGSLRRQSSLFGSSPGAMSASNAMDRTHYADGSWEPYEDFVGGIQFWGYALASGTRDGCVRMWDMRTGQAHRTLIGHTGPVTSVQFDEYHLVSGSLDKSIRIWDLRTGSISDTIKYDFPITALQFDNRKIVSAAGENGVKVYNRTTLEHSTLSINGHTAPVEKLRFMDKYLATGSRDCTVKIWALP